MFGIGKKKAQLIEDTKLYAPIDGQIIELASVSDPVFAKKMMGEGFAITPTGSQVVSPVAATVTMIEGHAIGLKRADGLEVLVHLGLDTVTLNGAPFNALVKAGDVVEGGTPVIEVDWEAVKDAGLETTTMIVFTNTNDVLADFDVQYQVVTAGEQIGSATVK
ncbi:PTS glucose transporter subunit IIA [Periweissella fabaria]|uniref:PTS system glucose-specific EIIA component n=1 Tax=Periweissella fabaria TaxID=546157 RepID=A0ABN8BKQ2_9LACO|nr:PTS glucose transporter subunit IIA [Periweissella fabaria]MCM0596595.1 PTS glucose transporter subunit IIA [Periweissella fabaria]CAH0416480.1 PTS system glucose-specific EIIA component [Periweissella fabaria]